MEDWKDIPGYEGIYQASNEGRIRSAPDKTTYTERHGVRHWKSRILKQKDKSHRIGKMNVLVYGLMENQNGSLQQDLSQWRGVTVTKMDLL